MIELPGNASKIDDYYSKFFKLSDADYGIYIDPSLSNFEEVFNDMTNLSYLLQKIIRDNINNNVYDFFDYYKYNNDYKEKILKELLEELNNSNTINDINSPFYKSKFNNILIDSSIIIIIKEKMILY